MDQKDPSVQNAAHKSTTSQSETPPLIKCAILAVITSHKGVATYFLSLRYNTVNGENVLVVVSQRNNSPILAIHMGIQGCILSPHRAVRCDLYSGVLVSSRIILCSDSQKLHRKTYIVLHAFTNI